MADEHLGSSEERELSDHKISIANDDSLSLKIASNDFSFVIADTERYSERRNEENWMLKAHEAMSHHVTKKHLCLKRVIEKEKYF